MLLALTASAVTGAQTPDTQSKPVALAVGVDADATPSLAEVITGMEAMDASAKQLASLGADTARVQALAAQIAEIEQTFSGNGNLASDVSNDALGFHELLDLGNNLRLADLRLGALSEELASKAEALDAALDDVDASTARVVTWTQAAKKRDAPPALQQRIQLLIPSQEALRGQLLARRDGILEVLGRATHLQGKVSSFRDEVSLRSDQLAAAFRTERSEPIWRIEPKPAEWRRVAKVLAAVSGQILSYLRAHAVLLLTIAVLTLGFTYLLIVATRAQLEALANSDSYGQRVSKLFERPWVAALAAMLSVVSVFSSDAPSGYQHLLWALLPLPGVLLARAVFGPGVSLSLYALAAAAIVQELIVPILEPLPIASRVILIAQCGGLAVAFGLDLNRRRFASAFPDLPAASVRWVVVAIIGVLVLAVLATIIGQIGAARVSRSLVLGALSLLLVLAVAAGLLFGIFLALMHTSAGQSLRIVREYQDDLGRFSRKALLVLAGVAWISGLVFLLGLGDYAAQLGGALHNAEIKIGSISIQMVAVWAGLAVILVTYLVVKIVSPLLEVEILPRFTRKQGLPFAVATVSRYLIVTFGVLLAMAAMGADLTKVSLLAGALGVGIGFGLQGVVNNFVSGPDSPGGTSGQCRRHHRDGPIVRSGRENRRAFQHRAHAEGSGSHPAECRPDLEGGHQLDAVGPQEARRDRSRYCPGE